MAERSKTDQPTDSADQEYVRGGKGRRDEVGKSGVYPASSPDAPPDAELRAPGEFVRNPVDKEQALVPRESETRDAGSESEEPPEE
jgi:hypothetical protein